LNERKTKERKRKKERKRENEKERKKGRKKEKRNIDGIEQNLEFWMHSGNLSGSFSSHWTNPMGVEILPLMT
jgi:hypothetical protein